VHHHGPAYDRTSATYTPGERTEYRLSRPQCIPLRAGCARLWRRSPGASAAESLAGCEWARLRPAGSGWDARPIDPYVPAISRTRYARRSRSCVLESITRSPHESIHGTSLGPSRGSSLAVLRPQYPLAQHSSIDSMMPIMAASDGPGASDAITAWTRLSSSTINIRCWPVVLPSTATEAIVQIRLPSSGAERPSHSGPCCRLRIRTGQTPLRPGSGNKVQVLPDSVHCARVPIHPRTHLVGME